MKQRLFISAFLILALAFAPGCKKKGDEPAATPAPTEEAAAKSETGDQTAPPTEEQHEGFATEDKQGVDLAGKTVIVGALNAETGPAAAIGKPYAIGKRIVVEAVNEGKIKVLADEWTLQWQEKDHGYNPQKAVQAYNEIKDRVLFIATSFGTPTTLPLLPHLKRDSMVAFPASLSSQMAANTFTPPTAASYAIEAMRSMDWAVEDAGGADKVKAAIVYQQDDYGKDGLEGWREAAKALNVTIVSEQTVAPGQKDMTAVVSALQKAGANYIMLTVLPSATGPILGTAFQLKYMPKWIGSTPAWIDAFFSGKVLPAPVFANFFWTSSLPFWGEKVPGMDKFLDAFNSYADPKTKPDFYILASYIQGLIEMEILKRVFESPDQMLTRGAFIKAMKSIKNFTADGFIQPVNLSNAPYVTSTQSRILKPDFEKQTWTVAADYAAPSSMKKAAKPAGKVEDSKVAPEGAAKPADTPAAAPAAPSDEKAEEAKPAVDKGEEKPADTVKE